MPARSTGMASIALAIVQQNFEKSSPSSRIFRNAFAPPIVASILDTLPYPLGTLFFWIVGRGLKLSLDLRQGG